jgi:hypothetical protein
MVTVMLKRFFSPPAALVLLLLTLMAASAHAQDAALNTRADAPLPDGAAVWVETLNDSDFNLSVQESFARALGEAGLAATDGSARLNLTFDTLEQLDAGNQDHLGEVRVDTRSDEVSLRLNMWSTTRDSLFKRRAGEGASARLLIVAILYDNEAQRRLWEAEASAPARLRNDKTRLANLVFRMVEQLGKTGRIDGITLN